MFQPAQRITTVATMGPTPGKYTCFCSWHMTDKTFSYFQGQIYRLNMWYSSMDGMYFHRPCMYVHKLLMATISNNLCLIAGQSKLPGPEDMRVRVNEIAILRRPAPPSVVSHNRSLYMSSFYG